MEYRDDNIVRHVTTLDNPTLAFTGWKLWLTGARPLVPGSRFPPTSGSFKTLSSCNARMPSIHELQSRRLIENSSTSQASSLNTSSKDSRKIDF